MGLNFDGCNGSQESHRPSGQVYRACQGNFGPGKSGPEGPFRSPGPFFSWNFGPSVEFESHIQSTLIRQPNVIIFQSRIESKKFTRLQADYLSCALLGGFLRFSETYNCEIATLVIMDGAEMKVTP